MVEREMKSVVSCDMCFVGDEKRMGKKVGL